MATSRSSWRSLPRYTMAIPPRPSSSMISYSEASASRTRSSSWSTPVAIAWTGVVAMRSRPQEGQNFDFPVISLPHREQNMRASYAAARLSQAETRGVSREGVAISGAAGQRGRGTEIRSLSDVASTPRGKTAPPRRCPAFVARMARHVQRPDPDQPALLPRRACGTISHDCFQSTEAQGRASPCRGPGTRVQLWVRSPLPPAERAADPGAHHPPWGEPRVQRAPAEVSGRPSALVVRSRPDHADAGKLDQPWGRWPHQARGPAAQFHADAHRHLRYQHRGYPAPGPGGGGGPGGEPGPATADPDAFATGGLADVGRGSGAA